CALHVYFEHDVVPLTQLLLDDAARRPVEVSVDDGPFQEAAAVAHARELLDVDEVVVHAVRLRGACLARSPGDRVADAGHCVEQATYERALAAARGRAYDEEDAAVSVRAFQVRAFARLTQRSAPA